MKKLALILTALISCLVIMASCGTGAQTAYENETFGIGFAPAGELVMANDAEIAAYASEGVTCEMMATDPNTGSIVVVSVEPAVFDDAKQYLEAVKSALDIDEYEISFDDIRTVKIAGENFAALTYSMSAIGLDASLATYARMVGEEMFVIHASYGDEVQLESLLDCFVAVG